MEAPYRVLAELFGEPNRKGDGHKVTTEWGVEDKNGFILDIYDYKATRLYDPTLPSVEAFRALDSYAWHIGGPDEEGIVEVALQLVQYVENHIKAHA